MKGLTTLVISMSTNLIVKAYNDILGNFVLLIYSNSLDRTLFYSNMTVSLCIRQGSKRNDDSVSVEELDWSAESQVLIPDEHLWCDFKCRPWAKNSSPNTNDLYIHYMDKSTGTPPSLEEKKALPNCGNKDENIINVLKNYISTSVATVLKWLYQYVQVIGVWWVFGSRSAFKVTPEVFSWD